jgi:NAD(P)-dependent dehydrogenase (short-subunit alcohol dehydrogenase family)
MAGATLGINQSIFDLKMEHFRESTELHLNGTVLPTLVFGRIWQCKRGIDYYISSMAILNLFRCRGIFCSKAAIDNFTKWMACRHSIKIRGGIP